MVITAIVAIAMFRDEARRLADGGADVDRCDLFVT
jgi:hypothetical protein